MQLDTCNADENQADMILPGVQKFSGLDKNFKTIVKNFCPRIKISEGNFFLTGLLLLTVVKCFDSQLVMIALKGRLIFLKCRVGNQHLASSKLY